MTPQADKQTEQQTNGEENKQTPNGKQIKPNNVKQQKQKKRHQTMPAKEKRTLANTN